MSNKNLAAIYVRKSKFTGKGESIKNQIDLCKQYALNHGYEVSEDFIYYDEGFSGGNVDRPAFKTLIGDIKQSKFKVLMCYRLDRISRSISDFSSTLELLKEYDIDFVSLKEQFDTSTPMGRAMMYIASVFAQLERETTAERIKDNMLQLARTGRWLGGNTPTGFKSESIIYLDKDMKERKMYKLTPVSNELELVKTLYAKYLKFESLSKVETYCLQNNIKTKNKKDFNKRQIRSIITNPVYAIADLSLYEYFESLESIISNNKDDFDGQHGIMVYNKSLIRKHKSVKNKDLKEWIVAIAKHKGIIPSADWINVQKLLEINKTKSPRQDTSSVGLLSGLIRCSQCGQPMRVKLGHARKDGTKPHYYICTLKEKSRGIRCDNTNLNGKIAEDLVITYIKDEIQKENGLLNKIHNASYSSIQENLDIESRINTLKDAIVSNDIAIKNLVKQLSLNEDSSAAKYIVNQIEELANKNESLNIELSKLKIKDISNDTLNLNLLKDLLENFVNIVEDGDIEYKRYLLNMLITSIQWDGTNLDVLLLGKKKLKNKGYPYKGDVAPFSVDSILYTPCCICC